SLLRYSPRSPLFPYTTLFRSTGTATYQSAPESLGRTGVPYSIEFHVSDRTRRTIFNLAHELDFFRGEIQVQQVSTANDKARTLIDRKSTRLNSSHVAISYAVF